MEELETLDKIFKPQRIALVGVTPNPKSVGGKILSNLITGGYLQDWLFLKSDWNWRLEPDHGGDLRVVADIGTHWMDLVTYYYRVENYRCNG